MINGEPLMPELQIKRAYEPRTQGDGHRVLVDRMWPRGIRKEELSDATWMKNVAPSATLRKWFGHKPERWIEFRRRYWKELSNADADVAELKSLMRKGRVTLLYSAHDQEHNQALALKQYLERH